jgi:IPT/TIG domain/Protein of unknown function (DUF642)
MGPPLRELLARPQRVKPRRHHPDPRHRGGAKYTLSFWMAGNPYCGNLLYKLKVIWGGTVSAEPTFDNRTGVHTPTSMGWTQHTYAVTAAGSGTSLEFESVEPEGACGPALDDVSVATNAPTITKLSAIKGPAAGGTSVTITGTNFTGANAVQFDSISATSFKVKSATSIIAVSPAETAKAVDVTVTTPNGTSAIPSLDHFKFGPPTVTNLSPNSGSSAGRTTVTVTGTGFGLGTEATAFMFGTTDATTVSCTSITTCSVVVPSHAAGPVDVKAIVSGMSSPKTLSDQFTYN